MYIRLAAIAACLGLASCGAFDPWEPAPEDHAFVARFERYCGTPGGGPLGDRACYAYIVMKDGRVDLLSGINSIANPYVTWRGNDDLLRSGDTYRPFFDEEFVERVVGPGELGFDEVHQRYLNYHVPQEE